jgi:hypothetical protein
MGATYIYLITKRSFGPKFEVNVEGSREGCNSLPKGNEYCFTFAVVHITELTLT